MSDDPELFYDPEKNEYIDIDIKKNNNLKNTIEDETYFLSYFIIIVLFLVVLNLSFEYDNNNLRIFKNYCDSSLF